MLINSDNDGSKQMDLKLREKLHNMLHTTSSIGTVDKGLVPYSQCDELRWILKKFSLAILAYSTRKHYVISNAKEYGFGDMGNHSSFFMSIIMSFPQLFL